jgi:hypothetical protein
MSEEQQQAAPVAAEPTAPVVAAEAPEVSTPDTAEASSVESKPPDEAAETKKVLRGVQKRIDELTRAKHEAEQRGRAEAEHWRQQAYAQAQRLAEIERNAPGPKFEQYNDIEAYSAAVARFEAEKAVKAGLEGERQAYANYQQEQAAIQQQQRAQQQYEQVLTSKLTAAEKKFPDFVEVITGPDLPGIQGTPAFNAILESDLGAEVMYYLGKNPVKAHQLVGLSPLGQVREIGRLEAAIQSGKLVSSAPPPPSTINSGKGSGPKDPTRMSYDEFVTWRRQTIAKRR